MLSNLYDNIIYKEKSKNIYFIGKGYKLFFPYNYTPCYCQYNGGGILEYYTCIKLYLDGIDIGEAIERIFYDLNSYFNNIELIFRFCSYIIQYLRKFYTLPSKIKSYGVKKSKSSKKVFIHGENRTKTYIKKLVKILFDGGNIDFLTLSVKERIGVYRNEVYDGLLVNGYYFHNFYWNIYFDDNGYLGLLERDLREGIDFDREYIGRYINLRFESNRLVVKFKRGINDKIRCYGFVEDVLDDFIAIGTIELYDILDFCGINREVFENNIRLENYTSFHLAKDIGCNVETEQPELLNRLKLNQMNELESLAYIGLQYHSHCIDYSHGVAEYEIQANYPIGASLADIKRDLKKLEPDIKPKNQFSIEHFLDLNNEHYNPKNYILLKKFLPIPEFSIELNKNNERTLSLNHEREYEIQDFENFAIPFLIYIPRKIFKNI